MGYRTVMDVPHATTYAEAKAKYDNTKPIRGSDNVRPLGARRDHHLYSVRQTANQDIEFVCYRTPVVTFMKRGDIVITNGGWSSVSTHQFIEQVLGIPASGKGKYSVLKINSTPVCLGSNQPLRIKLSTEADNKWEVLTEIRRPSYRINRKAANNVRRRYKEFTDYIKGFTKLRAEKVEPQWGDPYMGVVFTYDEMASVFGVNEGGTVTWRGMTKLLMPRGRRLDTDGNEHMNPGTAEQSKLLELVTSGDHQKFYEATLWLFGHEYDTKVSNASGSGGSSSANNFGRSVYYSNGYNLRRTASLGAERFDAFLMRWHADEVVESFETEPNAVPNMKYAEW